MLTSHRLQNGKEKDFLWKTCEFVKRQLGALRLFVCLFAFFSHLQFGALNSVGTLTGLVFLFYFLSCGDYFRFSTSLEKHTSCCGIVHTRVTET